MAKKDIVRKKKGEVIREAKINEDFKKEECRRAGVVIVLISAILLIIMIVSLFFVFDGYNDKDKSLADASKFKIEYEFLNEDYNTDKTKKHLALDVDKKNSIKYTNYEKVFEILDKKTGVIYFGFPECPWCRTIVPSLLSAAEEVGVDIYYLNNYEDRDIKEVNSKGEVETVKKGTDDYYKLVKKLDSILGEYKDVDSKLKRLYFPTVVFVKDGKIVDHHIGTLDSQSDTKTALTDKQKKELKNILIDKMNKTLICGDAC